MSYEKLSIHNNERTLSTIKSTYQKRYPEEYKHLSRFLDSYSNGEINKRHEVTEISQIRFIHDIGVFLRWLKKKKVPVSKIKKEVMSDFIKDLKSNTIRKKNGSSPYSEKTKNSIKLDVRCYIRYRIPKKAHELVDWFDLRDVIRTPEILTETEIEALYKSCKSESERFLITVLFDSGCRIEEFLNIRNEDIISPTESFPYYKLDLKEEYSKSDGRTIGLYWKYSSETIRNYLKTIDVTEQRKPVFNKSYDAIRMFLTRLGKKVLNKRIHAHIFRKSSATYYANKNLGREKLCIRYGWKFSSRMVDIYIKRAGLTEDDIKTKMYNDDLGVLTRKNNELETKYKMLLDENESTKNEVKNIKDNFKNDLQEIKREFINFLKSSMIDYTLDEKKSLIVNGQKFIYDKTKKQYIQT